MTKTRYLIPFLLVFIVLTGITCTTDNKIRLMTNDNLATLTEHPVFIDLSEVENEILPKDIVLYQETKEGNQAIPFQVNDNKLWFLRKGDSSAYVIQKGNSKKIGNRVEIRKENGDLVLSINDMPKLSYRYGIKYPPKGVDTIFRKSGYIHPVLSPKGDTLSRIQPPDHFHHYGMWGPWTHTQINGQQVDFWNLGDGKGTVLFEHFIDMDAGEVFASFNASQKHLDLITEDQPQLALNENLGIRLWDLDRPDRYILDYTTTFNTPLKNGVLFEAYRYGGGLGMRFTDRWHKDNCTVLTSEKKNRLSADGTNARWCIVKGESADGNGTNGILFMSHPENKSHPEPMRIWPIDANGGRGDMFFEFCPIRHEEWLIESQKEYELKYRMVVFEEDLTVPEAEAYWQAFIRAPKMSIIKN
ncbi:MAG: PmoA family protein [Maribacter sp.]|nr:PmoA family protein [Maribacter sp.]